jgi:hypothetical protein
MTAAGEDHPSEGEDPVRGPTAVVAIDPKRSLVVAVAIEIAI